MLIYSSVVDQKDLGGDDCNLMKELGLLCVNIKYFM